MDLAESEEYECCANSGDLGKIFERNLAFLMFVRGALRGYKFKLATEVTAAGKFEDVVVYVRHLQETWLIQAKHAKLPSNITLKELFPPLGSPLRDKDFDLCKYVKSFTKVARQAQFRKRYFIFTNRNLDDFKTDTMKGNPLHSHSNKSSNVLPIVEWFEVAPGEVDEMMNLSSFGGVYKMLKLKPNNCEAILSVVNAEFYKFIDALVVLFCNNNNKNIETHLNVLKDNKTILRRILKYAGDKIRFSDELLSSHSELPDMNAVYKELCRKFKTTCLQSMECQKVSGLLDDRNSRNTGFPDFVREEELKEFFNSFTMCLNQPSDVNEIIAHDLHMWFREFIYPEDLGRFGEKEINHSRAKFEQKFEQWHKTTMHGDCKSKSEKNKRIVKKLDSSEAEKCMINIQSDLKRHMTELPDVLKRYYVNRDISFRNTETICDKSFAEWLSKRCQSVLLLADPGMGKTTVMQYVSFESQKNSKLIDHYFINLKRLNSKLVDMKTEPKDLQEALDVLIEVLSDRSCKNIRENQHKRIICFLDGFDEVASYQKIKVVGICKQLLSIDRIQLVISGRKHVEQYLNENLPDLNQVTIVPFNYQAQIDFLAKFWNVSMEQEEVKKKFFKYVNKLLNAIHMLAHQPIQFTSQLSPLMVRMLAEIYSEDFITFNACKTDEANNHLEKLSIDAFDIITLYEKFLKKMFWMKIQKKNGLDAYCREWEFDDELMHTFKQTILEHQIAAIHQLNINELLHINQKHSQQYKAFQKRVTEGKEKSLLINFNEEAFQFVHRSYAEYLVATYLYENLEDCKENLNIIFHIEIVVRKLFFLLIEQCFGTNETKCAIVDRICEKNPEVAFWACESHCLSLVKHLLRRQNFKNVKVDEFGTLLHSAVMVNSSEITKFLLSEHRMDVNERSNVSLVCLPKTINDLSHRFFTGYFNITPLMLATNLGKLDMVKLLISCNAEVDAKTSEHFTLLHLAVENGFIEIVNFLISLPCDLNAQDIYQSTALHKALLLGRNEISELLIKQQSVNVNLTDKNGNAPIHLAAKRGYTKIVQLLVDRSVDLNISNKKNRQPLHYAAQEGHVDIIRILIVGGASIACTGKDTPLALSAISGNVTAVEYLLSYTEILNDQVLKEAIGNVVEVSCRETIKKLFKGPVMLSFCDDTGMSIHYAAMRGQYDVLEIQLSRTANFDNRIWSNMEFSRTDSHSAPEYVVRLLLGKSDNLNAEGPNRFDNYAEGDMFQTVLYTALARDFMNIVELLLSRSTNQQPQNLNHDNLLDLAIRNCPLDCIQLHINQRSCLNIHNKTKWTSLCTAINDARGNYVKQAIFIKYSKKWHSRAILCTFWAYLSNT
ncbi:uncharacterized protein LOC134214676 [Armigeres subalbatus]|uniref:uncharacterized protein LOC134214676 n=1 Tax=Armigeres subalbatus TaxID=124917 RepID=UPI002ED4177D